jgi:hypothetical protein
MPHLKIQKHEHTGKAPHMSDQSREYRNLFNGVIASTLGHALRIVAGPHSFIFPSVGSTESTFR